MSPYIRYPLVLGLVTTVAGLALFATYKGTRGAIEEQAEAARAAALAEVFPGGFGETEEVKDTAETILYTKVWRDEEATGPCDYFAVAGEAIGYNSSTPIRVLAGFVNPAASPPPPEAAGKDGHVLVGWSVLQSEETPGLGEKIKEKAPAYTLVGLVTGEKAAEDADRRTPFQKQFARPEAGEVYTPDELALAGNGGPIDAITGATITSRAIVNAIKDAAANLEEARGE
jgi:RnfABCDGE-type electron transport complex G subunit